MKASFVLFTSLLVAIYNAQSVPCPAKFGDCNKCIDFEGEVVALTRNICGKYYQNDCRAMYLGPEGLCSDGCNKCICGRKALIRTRMDCPRYDQDQCIAEHGTSWKCDSTMCYCTPQGIAFGTN